MTQCGHISLRISVTDRCGLRCIHCTPAGGLRRFATQQILRYEEILSFVRMIKSAFGLAKVHVTGGEPLQRRDIARLVGMLADEGISDLAMTTNAQQLAPLARTLRQAGLRRVNVSLHSLRPETYRTVTGGGNLAAALTGLEAALTEGFAAVKTNTTLLAGLNDRELPAIVRFALARGMEARFIELMPLGPAADCYAQRFLPASEALATLAKHYRLTLLPRQVGTSSRTYEAVGFDGTRGRLGMIASCSEPFCGDCNRLRLTSDGGLLGCLSRPARQEVLPILREGEPGMDGHLLEKALLALGGKRHDAGFSSHLSMAKVGG